MAGLKRDVTGDGPPVVFVHGSLSDKSSWAFLAPALSGSFRTIAYTRRGHDDGEPVGIPPTIHDHTQDLVDLLDELDMESAALVATSYGTNVALRAAASTPGRVSKIVGHEPPLVDRLSDEMTALFEDLRGRLLAFEANGDTDTALKTFVEEVALGPGAWDFLPDEGKAQMRNQMGLWMAELDEQDAYQLPDEVAVGVTADVLLTVGEMTPPILPAAARAAAAAFPAWRLEVIAGAAHVPHMTHAQAYAKVVADFVRGG